MAGLMCAALRQMQTDLQRSILQSLAALLPWHISAEQSPKAFIGHKRIQEKKQWAKQPFTGWLGIIIQVSDTNGAGFQL